MIRIALLAFAFLAATGAQAQVYKCLDSSGRTVYSQNPCPPSMKKEPMSRGGIPPASAVAPAAGAAEKGSKAGAPKTAAEQEQAFRQRQLEEAKASKEGAEKSAQAQAKEENCRNARARLSQFDIGGRITTVDEKGERTYMDDASIESGKARARADVSQFCN